LGKEGKGYFFYKEQFVPHHRKIKKHERKQQAPRSHTAGYGSTTNVIYTEVKKLVG